MPDPTPCDPALMSVAELAEGISGTIRMARGLVDGRRHVDLDGLDRMIGVLCARSLDLQPESGTAIRPQLATLLAELDGLGVSLAASLP